MAETFVEVDRLCRAAVEDGTVPGLVIGASDAGQVRLEAAWGAARLEPDLVPATPETVYDIASLTKAVATSVLAMQAVARGSLSLTSRVGDLLPELSEPDDIGRTATRLGGGRHVDPGKEVMSVRHLLSHSAGFPAHRPFYELATPAPDGHLAPSPTERVPPSSARMRILRAAAHEPLIYPPGQQSLYTDLGFMLLGAILERVGSDVGLDVSFDRQIAVPLGLTSSGFVATDDGGVARARWMARATVAATERCPWRGRLLIAEVHDPNAFAMGGVAGHAGLFSTVRDLGAIATALISDWLGHGQERLVPRDVIREFWRPAGVPHSTWRLGWDGPALTGDSQAGRLLSRAAVGHLGFTGCSLWIDPERARFIVVLGNRIHPRIPGDGRFRAFRPRLHDAIVEAFSTGTR
jgi:CubicO group peptidase (beta-lactamase class C family)